MHYQDDFGEKKKHILVHLKAADRFANHVLFSNIMGEECLELYRKAFKLIGMNKKPRIPSVTLLERCRPNWAKYFKASSYGEWKVC